MQGNRMCGMGGRSGRLREGEGERGRTVMCDESDLGVK